MKLVTFYAEYKEIRKIKDVPVPDDTTDEQVRRMRHEIEQQYTNLGINNVLQVTAEMNSQYYSDK